MRRSLPDVPTEILVISDTCASEAVNQLVFPPRTVDVAIHCGNLTQYSELDEFHTTLDLMKKIPARRKLVIAGNNDFALDKQSFAEIRRAAEGTPSEDSDGEDKTAEKEYYGDIGDARHLFERKDIKEAGIVYLTPGSHQFHLANGANLTVYACPCTPDVRHGDGFQYTRTKGHDFDIKNNIDVVITHGPPMGILDVRCNNTHSGCEQLFAAVARARPRLHCFGHIRQGWGAKLVAWRDPPSANPSYLTDIDNDKSVVVDTLDTYHPRNGDTSGDLADKSSRLSKLRETGYRATEWPSRSGGPVGPGKSTLFVNASIQSATNAQPQIPWPDVCNTPTADLTTTGLRSRRSGWLETCGLGMIKSGVTALCGAFGGCTRITTCRHFVNTKTPRHHRTDQNLDAAQLQTCPT
ncbi:Metallo-dependent phosphatase-like protein [Echria macrotheca]|uniref:Metallo-dependent phosphatase-like protein n=1 Tax=Echria macrotheca TaxID=438768 RepID=A0AAJ0BAW1_9PEZI|nr:Metallo-dependent phosphatase-like protein [Echria macrotheca]